MNLAIAISLYDRWDELQGLLELLRLNWKSGRDLHVSVTSTAAEDDMPRWVNRAMVDSWSFGSVYDLPAKRSSVIRPLHDRRYGEYKRLLRARTVDCIQRGCRKAMVSGKDFTLHLHAAAWPMKEDEISRIIGAMEAKQYMFAGRGYGRKLIDGKHPEGDIDDNFFFIRNGFARSKRFWEIDPAEDASVMGAEGKITRRAYELCREKEICYYEDFSDATEYIYPPEADQRRVQPYNYHKPTGMLRSHDMGLQAMLCREFGYSGPWLDTMISEHIDVPASEELVQV